MSGPALRAPLGAPASSRPGTAGVPPASSASGALTRIAAIPLTTPLPRDATPFTPIRSATITGATIRHRAAEISAEGTDGLRVHAGEVMLNPTRNTRVSIGNVELIAPAGSALLVSNHNGVVTIRNLYDAGRATIVIVGDQTVSLTAGRELIVARNATTVHTLQQSDNLGRRKTRTMEVAGVCVSTSDISLVSLMQDHHVLKSLLNSSNPQDRQLGNKLIKTAACLMQVTFSRGAYAQSR